MYAPVLILKNFSSNRQPSCLSIPRMLLTNAAHLYCRVCRALINSRSWWISSSTMWTHAKACLPWPAGPTWKHQFYLSLHCSGCSAWSPWDKPHAHGHLLFSSSPTLFIWIDGHLKQYNPFQNLLKCGQFTKCHNTTYLQHVSKLDFSSFSVY